MVHVQHMQLDDTHDTVAHGNFPTMESALAAIAERTYGPGHWQEIVDEEMQVRFVRADGSPDWVECCLGAGASRD